MTGVQLGQAVGVDKSTISRLERGSMKASISVYRRLGEALGVDWWTLAEHQEQTT